MNNSNSIISTLAAGGTAASLGGSITVVTVPTAVTTTVSAGGLAGLLGFTTTTTIVAAPVTVPIVGVLAVGGLLTYSGVQAYKWIRGREQTQN